MHDFTVGGELVTEASASLLPHTAVTLYRPSPNTERSREVEQHEIPMGMRGCTQAADVSPAGAADNAEMGVQDDKNEKIPEA